jgi:site-specific DNA-methyltransferase (cytosine-N4-specific)
MNIYFETQKGKIYLGNALDVLQEMEDHSINLILTSPPFGLVRKKEYGNVSAENYIDWFKPFAKEFYRILSNDGSFVIDIGGSWNPGLPTRSLYHFKLVIMLCEEIGFHLAQEFYWWNPSKLPTPAEWVTVRRIRVKDAVNIVYWLSKSPFPKANNKRVLQPYSESMKELLKNGYKAKKRPSGHDISDKFTKNNKAAIPPNLLTIPNTESNSYYLRYCKEKGIKPHPARFPDELPEFFIRMLTDKNDLVLDPFAGSCVTGEVCERLDRRWICIDIVEEYLQGAKARFRSQIKQRSNSKAKYYKVPRPGLLWNEFEDVPLLKDGGKERPGIQEKINSITNRST